MRRATATALAAALLAALVGCSRPSSEQGKVLNVYMWSEYIDPQIPEDFESQTGIKVRVDVYESTEDMMAKLQHGGAGQYDMVVVSDHAVPVLAKLGLLEPLDMGRIPNAANVDPRFKSPGYDPDNKYSLPYQWGTVGLMYRKDRIPEFDPSWAVLFAPDKQAGPFVLIDSMRDMLGVALKYLGHSANSVSLEEIRRAGELVLAAKKSPQAVGFEGGVGGKNKVLSKAAALAIVYNGDALRAIEEDDQIAFVVPKEGSIVWVDAMVVTKGAANPGAAHQFINFILDPGIGGQLSNFNQYATPNLAAMPFIDEAARNDPAVYPPAEVFSKLEYLEDVGDATKLYDEIWTGVKSQ